MNESNGFARELESFCGQNVVVDVSAPFTYIGKLQAIDANSITLVEADVHDLRETTTSTDRYLVETHKHGIRVNRHRVTILSRNIVSVSPLEAVVPY